MTDQPPVAAARAASILAIVLSLLLSGCADQVLINPSTHPLDAHGAVRRMFDHNGRSIELYVARSPGAAAGVVPAAFVLEFCGNAMRAERIASQRATRWGMHPVEVWTMNYPGFGQSQGPATLQSVPDAAIAAYDQLANVAGTRPIFLGGYSLGTAAAMFVAAHRPVAGLILQSPPPIRRLIVDHYGWWNLWLIAGPTAKQVPEALDSLANGPLIKSPAIFLLSARDGIVPLQYQRRVVDAYGGLKMIQYMKDATHDSMIADREETRLRENLEWLWGRAGEQR